MLDKTETQADPANYVWNTINTIAQGARPKQKYRLGLGDWSAATPEQRVAMDAWCAKNNYELVIDINDLGPMNDHVRDMDVWDKDLLEKDPEDINEVLIRQSGGGV